MGLAQVPPETSEEDLTSAFGEHGEIKQMQVRMGARLRVSMEACWMWWKVQMGTGLVVVKEYSLH